MKVKILIALCLTAMYAMMPASMWAESPNGNVTDANVYGHVVSKKDGEHLPYISVIVKGTTVGTTTDASGHYFLKNLPVGTFTIEVKSLG